MYKKISQNNLRKYDSFQAAPNRSTFIKYPVFSPSFTFDEEGNMVAAEGFLVDMLRLIQDQLNFTASLSITVDGKFGGRARI